VIAAALVVLALPSQASAGSITYRDRVPAGEARSVSLAVRSATAFEVVLQVPRTGRTQLFLSGAKAPRGGPLIDTRSYRCPRAGPRRTCRAAYESLPAGTYVFRVRRVSGETGPVSLTIRW